MCNIRWTVYIHGQIGNSFGISRIMPMVYYILGQDEKST